MPHSSGQTSTRTEPLAVSVGRATHTAGLGRTKLYEALGSGELSSLKIGNRRLILVDDLRNWLALHKQGRC
jgi:excisionase family DNA binding protein